MPVAAHSSQNGNISQSERWVNHRAVASGIRPWTHIRVNHEFYSGMNQKG